MEPETSTPNSDIFPQHTVKVAKALAGGFLEVFVLRAVAYAQRRSSQTVTDADMRQAYKDLTVESDRSRLRRCSGDFAMFFGGGLMFLPAGSTYPWLLSVAGAIIVTLGLLLREWAN